MIQNRFQEIEEFLMDDEFFAWVKRGAVTNDPQFSLSIYKEKHPGKEKEIDLALLMLQSLTIEEDPKTSLAYKKRSFEAMMAKQAVAAQHKNTTQKHNTKRILLYAANVAAIFCLAFISYFWISQLSMEHHSESVAQVTEEVKESTNEIEIFFDGNKAVGVAKNNTEIEVAQDGAVVVDKELLASATQEEIRENKVVVPFGKRTKLILPDGTQLWINSGSSVTYPSNFKTNRHLQVEGEVYLDVERDENHPFVVKTNHLEVEVLGTAFNVTDYVEDETSSVVLVRGSVGVKTNKEKTKLKPNQRLALKGEESARVSQVDVYRYICWKDDLMNFEGEKLAEIVKALSRYYNKPIQVEGEAAQVVFYGSLDLSGSLEDVLEYISLSLPLEITTQKESIQITAKKK